MSLATGSQTPDDRDHAVGEGKPPKPYRSKTDTLPTCKNCTAILYGGFCSQCGQRAAAPLTFSAIRGVLIKRLREFDFAWPRTALALLTDPGRLARIYIEGRRKPFVNPLSYALGASALLAISAALAPVDLGAPALPWGPRPPFGPSYRLFAFAAFGGILASLAMAALQQSLHRDERYNLLETWVFGLFICGHIAMLGTLFALLGAFGSVVGVLTVALVIVLVIAFSLGGFYRRSVIQMVPAALILGVTFMAGVLVVSSLARLMTSS